MSSANERRPKIMIGIPTCMRPDMLSVCLESIGGIALPAGVEVCLVVADNDVDESARAVVEAFSRKAGFPVEYTVCPQRGLSNIRNHLLDYAVAMNADFIACSDDDDGAVSPTWLASLYEVILETGADAVGPAHGGYDKIENPALPSGNIMMSASIYRELGLRFDPLFNFTGSEDTDFGKRAVKLGAKFVGDPRIEANAWIKNPDAGPEHRQGWWFHTKRHYVRVLVSTYVNRTKHGKPIALILIEALFNLIKGVVLLPAAIFCQSQRWRCTKSLVTAAAFPMSLLGPGKYEPYRKMDGY